MKFTEWLKEYKHDYKPSCLDECIKDNDVLLLKEFLESNIIKTVDFPNDKYSIQTNSMKGPNNKDINFDTYVTYPEKYYIGNKKDFDYYVGKLGLSDLQPGYPKKYNVCNIGFSKKDNKWYGWSHRAIVGFGIGDKIFDENFGSSNTLFKDHGKDPIKNMNDAKQAAINFAEYVS